MKRKESENCTGREAVVATMGDMNVVSWPDAVQEDLQNIV